MGTRGWCAAHIATTSHMLLTSKHARANACVRIHHCIVAILMRTCLCEASARSCMH